MTTDESEFLLGGDEIPTLNVLMRLMADQGGSDLFVSTGAQLRIKINGAQRLVMRQIVKQDDIELMLAENLTSEQLTVLEDTKELNCAISLARVGRFRMSAFHQRSSKSFVLRFIPPEIPPFELLGMPDVLKDLINLKRGLVIISGPTGCGKSTTLASMIQLRNETKSDHIITIEDPIEFLFRHRKSIVNQRELGVDTLSYDEALKNAMRQAPDVILIGEIRDQKTMSMAMQYAQSGHLCLATLHASNSYNAMNRIVGFYPPEQREALYSDLATSLKSIVAQRLIPSSRGGRVACVEVMINNRGVAELIEKGKINEIPDRMEKNSSDGSQTFETVLIQMVKERRISVDDALIYSDSPTNLYWRMSSEGVDMTDDAAANAGVDATTIPASAVTKSEDKSGGNAAMFAGIVIKNLDNDNGAT